MFELIFKKKIASRSVEPSTCVELPSQRVMPTVKFDSSLVTDEIKLDIEAAIRTFHDIQSKDFDKVYQAAMLSVSRGRDLSSFSSTLMTIDNMTRRRAGEISLRVNNRATALMHNTRQLKLGITHSIWRYSGTPCGNEGQDAVHKRLDGKRFSIRKGMPIGKRRAWPGQDEGCKCVQQPVIPGFD